MVQKSHHDHRSILPSPGDAEVPPGPAAFDACVCDDSIVDILRRLGLQEGVEKLSPELAFLFRPILTGIFAPVWVDCHGLPGRRRTEN